MLKFWELSPSPNNIKVRLALRFKGIEFETIPVDPMDRRKVVEVSGQELTPVIEDRGIVLNDSEAILQYLDANYPDTPRLFPAERAGRKGCDAWKSELDKQVVAHWLPVFLEAIGRAGSFDPAAREGYEQMLKSFEERLAGDDPFGGSTAPVNDLRVAEWAVYGLPGPGLLERVPFMRRVTEAYAIPAGSLPRLERFLAPWNERLG